MASESERERIEQDERYRRGVHQAIHACLRWLESCATLDEARALLSRAEAEAKGRRFSREPQPFLLDRIEEALRQGRNP